MGFAQKLILKRQASDSCAKIARTFLSGINGFMWLLAGMMCDAASETMNLIRLLDDEMVDITKVCEQIDHYLKHITWMFMERGVFQIQGHTCFIVQWFQTSAHTFVIGRLSRTYTFAFISCCSCLPLF